MHTSKIMENDVFLCDSSVLHFFYKYVHFYSCFCSRKYKSLVVIIIQHQISGLKVDEFMRHC